MKDPRSHPKVRQGAVMLSSLVLTPDSALAAYRKQRSGDPDVDLERLKQARGVLDAVAQAISSGNAPRWQRVARAFALLEADAVLDTSEPEAAPPQMAQAPTPPAAAKPSPPQKAQAPAPSAAMPLAPPQMAPPPSSAPSPWSTTPARPFVAVVAPVAAAVVAPVAPVVAPVVAPIAPIAMPLAPPQLAPPVVESDPAIDGTAELNVASLSLADPLPFRASTTSSPPPFEPMEEFVGKGETACFPAINLDDVAPSQREPSRAPGPSLTLEQYACLCVERGLYPADATRARYHIADEAAERALDTEWHAALASDPSMRAAFDARCQSYRAWLRAR